MKWSWEGGGKEVQRAERKWRGEGTEEDRGVIRWGVLTFTSTPSEESCASIREIISARAASCSSLSLNCGGRRWACYPNHSHPHSTSIKVVDVSQPTSPHRTPPHTYQYLESHDTSAPTNLTSPSTHPILCAPILPHSTCLIQLILLLLV